MYTKLLATVVLALGVSAGAQASLTSSGPDTVYDSVQNLTWTKDANIAGVMNWDAANTWASNLVVDGYSGWILPNDVQLFTQFRTNLGEAEGSSIADSHNANYSLFINVQSDLYWSGTDPFPNPFPGFARAFDFCYGCFAVFFNAHNGIPDYTNKFDQLYAWAVRPGNVAAVPVPGAFWLFGSALAGLMGLKRRGNIG